MRYLFALILLTATAFTDSRIALTLDTSEADAVLTILDKRSTKSEVTNDDWQKIFSSEPYVRLKQREASMKRSFTDNDFETFVMSADLLKRAPALKQTLADWKKADLNSAAGRVCLSSGHRRHSRQGLSGNQAHDEQLRLGNKDECRHLSLHRPGQIIRRIREHRRA